MMINTMEVESNSYIHDVVFAICLNEINVIPTTVYHHERGICTPLYVATGTVYELEAISHAARTTLFVLH